MTDAPRFSQTPDGVADGYTGEELYSSPRERIPFLMDAKQAEIITKLFADILTKGQPMPIILHKDDIVTIDDDKCEHVGKRGRVIDPCPVLWSTQVLVSVDGVPTTLARHEVEALTW